mmetsp:Transcript_70888/g.196256  ORF Transcript_70888/g.196256 Transcript_70888/m.196256 type:complete len:236 (+) Transcript_70888:242-949(+)
MFSADRAKHVTAAAGASKAALVESKVVKDIKRWGGTTEFETEAVKDRLDAKRGQLRALSTALMAFQAAGKKADGGKVLTSALSLPELQAAPKGGLDLVPTSELKGCKTWYGLNGYLNIERPEVDEERKRKKKTKIEAVFWWHLPVTLKRVEVDAEDAEARRKRKKRLRALAKAKAKTNAVIAIAGMAPARPLGGAGGAPRAAPVAAAAAGADIAESSARIRDAVAKARALRERKL